MLLELLPPNTAEGSDSKERTEAFITQFIDITRKQMEERFNLLKGIGVAGNSSVNESSQGTPADDQRRASVVSLTRAAPKHMNIASTSNHDNITAVDHDGDYIVEMDWGSEDENQNGSAVGFPLTIHSWS